jgi:hypothetical protein
MELKDIKVLPGIVIDVNDPKYIGRVKADSPGLFDSSIMNKEGLPWIYPFTMNGYQRFSKLRGGSKIWIFCDSDYHEFWYIPMFQLNDDTKEIISSDDNDYQEGEVLLSRSSGENGVYIYYRPSEGIVIKNGNDTNIVLTPDNIIKITSGKSSITVKDGGVFIGDESKKMQPAVFGQTLVNMLEQLKGNFLSLQEAATFGGYTTPLAKGFEECVNTLGDTQSLLTNNTKVN